MPTVAPGSTVAVTADTMGTRPKWLEWIATGSAAGSAELPSGHRRAVMLSGSTRSTEDYFVTPETIGSTSAEWRAVIFASNGSHIYADGLTGFPTVGTPSVRLMADAPAKSILQIPVRRGSANIMDPDFDGWSDGHTEAVGRGMEMTVEFRGPSGSMTTVFRGMIFQVEVGEVVTLTAYDRLMDLYQFSDQYQSHMGYTQQRTALQSHADGYYKYTLSEVPGSILSITARSVVQMRNDYHEGAEYQQNTRKSYWVIHSLPSYGGVTPSAGNKITYVRMTYTQRGASLKVGLALFRVSGGTVTMVRREPDKAPINSLLFGSSAEWSVDWTLEGNVSEYYIGEYIEMTQVTATTNYWAWAGSLNDMGMYSNYYYVTSNYGDLAPPGSLSSWASGIPYHGDPSTKVYPQPAVKYEEENAISLTGVTTSGKTVSVPDANIPTYYIANYVSTPNPGYEAEIAFQIASGSGLQTIARELMEWAGLQVDMDPGADFGTTTFYQSSTYDFLTCVQELIRGGNYGIRASIDEPGLVEVYPRHSTDDATVATFTTAPDGSGERVVTSHSLTAHWMAEKATQAILAENATESGLPIALETDDLLLPGSLCKALQSPLRGVTADNTLGTHLLMATAAGGKMVQLHTNVFEGTMTLAGYRTDIWTFAGSYVGGQPIGIIVPEYGANGAAVPTQITFGDGVTQISLDNIRGPDRSEMARSMGLTADALNNTVSSLPATSFIFARYDDYDTQETGLTPDTVTLVEFLQDGGTVAASQNDPAYIKTVEDLAGYYHVCAVLPTSLVGYAASDPIVAVRFTMGADTFTAVLDNPKYALGGQALHADIRFRKA